MIVLQSPALIVRLDPAHGGEFLDLVDVATGRQLLGRPPFASSSPLDRDIDEKAWIAGYRGGWQLLTPNAGSACNIDGELHSFHGRASTAPWHTLCGGRTNVILSWSGYGLQVTRTVSLKGASVVAETEWRALRNHALFLAVEHIALGLELLAPSATIRLPGGVAFESSETEGPVQAPKDAPAWPDVLLLDGRVESAATFSLSEPSARFVAAQWLPEGWYEVVNDETGQGLRIEWDVTSLPHLWLWREVRATGGSWRSHAEILALEPASVPHALGLARAESAGQATVLDLGGRFTSRIVATPFHRRRGRSRRRR